MTVGTTTLSRSIKVGLNVYVFLRVSPFKNLTNTNSCKWMINTHDCIYLKSFVPHSIFTDGIVDVSLFCPFLNIDILSNGFGSTGESNHDAGNGFW